MDQTKWSVDAPTMKASTQTGESGVCETTAAWWGCRTPPPERWRGGSRARRRWLRQPARGPVGRAGAYFKPGRALHRPLCETVGYARRAAANSRPLAYRRKEKWNAAQWCGRARRLYTPRGLQ
ncbi:unnamed protein product [Chrysodeixis includens]|uniref:Uncharacterized protein n=1 Tax=Chrysodeixis includens TaxID=689277 RepID=A0A9N8KV46_CHRIL|nr:unnamed protein product [Chrysodeixis includens]